jgi:hypothetical protein
MYECEECLGEEGSSRYHFPMIDQTGKQKILHLECCSRESLLKLLHRRVENELMFYNDVKELANNPTSNFILKFEQKYGTFDEVKDGLQIDRFKEILAMIDQIKNK